MVEAGFSAPRRDREIHAWIIKHPFGVIRLDHGGLGSEQRRVEANGLRKVIDGDMNVQTLHGLSFQAGILLRLRAGLQSTAGAHCAPPQQFSVKNPSKEFMVS